MVLVGEIISFFADVVNIIFEEFDLDVRIDFENVGGHFDFEVFASDSLSTPSHSSVTAIGAACTNEVYIGLTLAIDLVFSSTAIIDLEARFEFSFPEGAYITVHPFTGHIVDRGL